MTSQAVKPYRYLLSSWTTDHPHSASMVFSKRISAELAFHELTQRRVLNQTVQLKDTATGDVLAQSQIDERAVIDAGS
jgi:hypothetical protein